MPSIATHSPDNPDFARVVAVRGLPTRSDFAFDIAPDADEAARLARLLGAQSVAKMRLAGTLAPEDGGWTLDATLSARVVQTCVVTLDPVTTRIDQPVRRRFRPEAGPQSHEIVLDADEDETEPLGERIDLGLIAIEALALALPDYPRKEGARLPGDDEPEEEEGRAKPFAALASLRDKLDPGDRT